MTDVGFLVHVYLLVAFMAMGSWALYLGIVTLEPFTGREYLELRVVITLFGVIAYGILALMSYNVAVPDGQGDVIIASYTSMATISLIAAVATGMFLIDSVMRTIARESLTGEQDKAVEL